jgi:mannose-6-phosphate isomerase-like protein (cupin superfamily)
MLTAGTKANAQHPVEVHRWVEEGYSPLVFHRDWQVALLNWEPIFDSANLREIERHRQTDEVFVLWRGRALLFTANEAGIGLREMEPGVLYNVTQGTWHNLVATRDASFIIVETRDTHLHDTEIRPMTDGELAQLRAGLPPWAVPGA